MFLLAKYGVAFTVDFALHALDGQSLQKAAVHAAGDTILMKDEAAEANTTNAFVDRGSGYSLALTAAEMTAARLLLMIDDQSGPKVWLPKSYEILTFGNASAHIGFDLSQITPAVNTTQLNGSATAGALQALAALGVVSGSFVTGTLSTDEATTNLTGADNAYNRRQLIPISGSAQGQAVRIRQSLNSSGRLRYDPLTASPANGDLFIVV
jgi:hypothetical protein